MAARFFTWVLSGRRSFAVLTAAALAIATPLAAHAIPQPDALTLDAANYSLAYGVSLDEALRRLGTEEALGDLDAELAATESATYAGLWITNSPEFGAFAAFTVDAPATLAKHTDGSAVLKLVRPVLAKYSLAKLEAEEVRIHALYPADFVLWIDVSTNRVITHPVAGDTPTTVGPAALALSDMDIYSPDPVESRNASDFYGGLPLNNGSHICTSGLSVLHNGDYVQGTTTAGHCDNPETYNGVPLTFKGEREGGSDDEQWHTVPGATIHPWVRDSASSHRAILSKSYRSQQPQGGTVCKYGRTTGYTCGEIVNKSYCWPNGACTFIQVSRFGTNLDDGGDSGGPVYIGNDAYGLVKGEHCFITCNDMVYTAIDYVQSGLSVTIMLGQ